MSEKAAEPRDAAVSGPSAAAVSLRHAPTEWAVVMDGDLHPPSRFGNYGMNADHSARVAGDQEEVVKLTGLTEEQRTASNSADRGHGPGSEIGLRLLRQICHDVRQELAIIQALVELVATKPDMPEQSLRRLDQICGRTSYITEMMQQVIERTASVNDLDLAAFVTDVVADVQLRTETRCQLQASPSRVVADPVLLRRAVLNMLDNAVRAAGHAGFVSVRVSGAGDDVLIDVEDNGPGFGAATPGLASLGLAVVDECARTHGGRVDSGTRRDGGAFVRLRLPSVPFW